MRCGMSISFDARVWRKFAPSKGVAQVTIASLVASVACAEEH